MAIFYLLDVKSLVLKVLLGSISFLLYAQPCISQEVDLQNYRLTQYGMEEGLHQSTINDIIQTRDGYIWLATFGGLVRFDGFSFTTYDRSNTKGMRSDRILHLFEDSSGAIWLGTEGGLLKFENGECTFYLIEDNTFVYSPSMMKEDSKGTIWLLANSNAYIVNESSVDRVDILQDSLLAQEALNNSDGVWLAHENEILRTYGDQVIQVADLSSEVNHIIEDFVEFPKNSGEYFFGTTGDGVFYQKDGVLRLFNESDGLSSRYTWNLYIDKKENLWVTSYSGVSFWNGSGFTQLEINDVPDEVQFSKVFEDNEGNYWIGSQGDGLFKFRPAQISTIGRREGLKNDIMLSLAALNDDTYVFATNCGGIYSYDPASQTLVQPPISDLLPNQCIWSVFQDSKDRIWFGSRILYRSNSLSEPGVIIDENHGFDGTEVFTISEDSNGNIWIGAINGLYKYDGESYFRYSTEDGLSYNDTRTVFEDQNGVMWVGTSSGLNKIVNGTVEQFALTEIETGDNITQEPYVRAIHQDDEGVMWIGTYGNGIFRIKDEKVMNIKTEDGLFDNIVSHIQEDRYGSFWMGSNRGIFSVQKSELNDFSENNITEISSFVYGVNDGMLSAETNGGFEPNVIQSEDGQLYFPTVSGVAIVSTENPVEERQPPIVYIENVKNGEIDFSNRDVVNLDYNNAYLQIDYTALSFRDPDKVIFQYQLEGLNENWFEVGNTRSALFTNIPPGEYTFKVTASSNNGPWNSQFASIGVVVDPPFWQTTWFYTILFFLLVSTGPTFYYLRVRQLRRENERQKRFTERLIDSQEKERRRIASELHDGLGQQILVIKNRAELAQQQAEDPEEMVKQLNEIVQSAVLSIGDVRNISHNLRPVHLEKFGLTEAIENLCDQLKRTSKIDWGYHIDNIDDVISKNKEIHFYRVIQEATNNILKHSHAKEASVMIMKIDSEIKATIWDDGKSFDKSEENVNTGLGFSGMYERVETLGGKINIEAKPGEGTGIKIIIPY